jgi:hypothetical protein
MSSVLKPLEQIIKSLNNTLKIGIKNTGNSVQLKFRIFKKGVCQIFMWTVNFHMSNISKIFCTPQRYFDTLLSPHPASNGKRIYIKLSFFLYKITEEQFLWHSPFKLIIFKVRIVESSPRCLMVSPWYHPGKRGGGGSKKYN